MPLKVVLILANSADPDEMQHGASFHLGLHCLHINQTTLRQHFTQFVPHQQRVDEIFNIT